MEWPGFFLERKGTFGSLLRLNLNNIMQVDLIQTEGEAALKRIASECQSSIDDVLDILAQLPKREQPGGCMLCFFSLYRKLPPRCLPDLNRVKAWLEQEIEVVATDDAANLLEAFPCRIAERELEEFCQRVIEESKSLLKPGMKRLMLQFRFAGEHRQTA
jgi:hypothetical protein